jgi:hypothetical protein
LVYAVLWRRSVRWGSTFAGANVPSVRSNDGLLAGRASRGRRGECVRVRRTPARATAFACGLDDDDDMDEPDAWRDSEALDYPLPYSN